MALAAMACSGGGMSIQCVKLTTKRRLRASTWFPVFAAWMDVLVPGTGEMIRKPGPVVDIRGLNAIIIKESYPVPSQEEMLARTRGISKKSGLGAIAMFYQWLVAERGGRKFTVNSHRGQKQSVHGLVEGVYYTTTLTRMPIQEPWQSPVGFRPYGFGYANGVNWSPSKRKALVDQWSHSTRHARCYRNVTWKGYALGVAAEELLDFGSEIIDEWKL